jgi:hypothetical protein
MYTILTDVWNLLPSTKWIRNTGGYSSLILHRFHSWKTADYIFMLCIIIKNRKMKDCNSEWLYQAKYKKDYKKLTMTSGQWLVNRFCGSPLSCLHDPLHISRICKRIFIQNIGISNHIKVMIEFDRWSYSTSSCCIYKDVLSIKTFSCSSYWRYELISWPTPELFQGDAARKFVYELMIKLVKNIFMDHPSVVGFCI